MEPTNMKETEGTEIAARKVCSEENKAKAITTRIYAINRLITQFKITHPKTLDRIVVKICRVSLGGSNSWQLRQQRELHPHLTPSRCSSSSTSFGLKIKTKMCWTSSQAFSRC